MALSGSTLSGLIYSDLVSKGFAYNVGSAAQGNWLQDLCDAIGDSVVAHITGAAIVTTTSGAPDSEHSGTIS